MIYTYDEEPTVRSDLKLLFSVHDEGGMKLLAVNVSESYITAMRFLFENCKDENLRDKLFLKTLTELSQLPPESFASEMPKYINFTTQIILAAMFELEALKKDRHSFFSSLTTREQNPEAFKKAIIKLLDSIKPQGI